MRFQLITVLAVVFLFLGAESFALSEKAVKNKGNGGKIYQQQKSQIELNKEESLRRAEAAKLKTEELNKDWKKQQKKAEKAKAKAKAKAKKLAEKKKKLAEKEARKAEKK